jgi:hypothetical protein
MLLGMTTLVLGQCKPLDLDTNFQLPTPHSHFVRQNLPKIRFDNPNLVIEVERVKKTEKERWRPEMELEFGE